MNVSREQFIGVNNFQISKTKSGQELLGLIGDEVCGHSKSQITGYQEITKCFNDFDFICPVRKGNVIEIGLELIDVGTSSITFKCDVRDLLLKKTIITMSEWVLVNINEDGEACPHGKTPEDFSEKSS